MTDLLRIGFRITDDDVIEQIDIDDLSGFPEDAGLCEATDYVKWAGESMAGARLE